MPFDRSAVKWAIFTGVTSVVGTLAVNAGYVLLGLRWWSEPAPGILPQAQTAAPYIVLGIFLTTAGAVLSTRLTAHWPRRSPRLTGLVIGSGLALLVFAMGLIRGGLGFWLPPNAFMAVVGGWLGGWAPHHV